MVVDSGHSVSGLQMLEWTMSLISQSQDQGLAVLGVESFFICLVILHCLVLAKSSGLNLHYR